MLPYELLFPDLHQIWTNSSTLFLHPHSYSNSNVTEAISCSYDSHPPVTRTHFESPTIFDVAQDFVGQLISHHHRFFRLSAPCRCGQKYSQLLYFVFRSLYFSFVQLSKNIRRSLAPRVTSFPSPITPDDQQSRGSFRASSILLFLKHRLLAGPLALFRSPFTQITSKGLAAPRIPAIQARPRVHSEADEETQAELGTFVQQVRRLSWHDDICCVCHAELSDGWPGGRGVRAGNATVFHSIPLSSPLLDCMEKL